MAEDVGCSVYLAVARREFPSVAFIFQTRHVAWSSPELGRSLGMRKKEAGREGDSKESQDGKCKMAKWC